MGKIPETKYRPSLTASQIAKIVALAKTETPLSSESIGILATLAPFQAKIEAGAISAAYTTVARASIEEQLGIPTDSDTHASGSTVPSHYAIHTSPLHTVDSTSYPTKESYWLACYNKQEEQGKVACSLAEIQAAREHAYLHSLMTPEEEAEFEAQLAQLIPTASHHTRD